MSTPLRARWGRTSCHWERETDSGNEPRANAMRRQSVNGETIFGVGRPPVGLQASLAGSQTWPLAQSFPQISDLRRIRCHSWSKTHCRWSSCSSWHRPRYSNDVAKEDITSAKPLAIMALNTTCIPPFNSPVESEGCHISPDRQRRGNQRGLMIDFGV
jgi:hypothetical protein